MRLNMEQSGEYRIQQHGGHFNWGVRGDTSSRKPQLTFASTQLLSGFPSVARKKICSRVEA